MRRRGTIKSRSPGSFRIRYSLDRDPVTGKRRWATATVKGSRKDAERELTRRLRTLDTGEHVDPQRMTVADWLSLWLASTRAEVSPKTHERYTEIVRCYLIPGLGGLALQRLTPSDISRAYASFTRDPSPRTRRHIHRILKSALARAVEQQALARNPADALKRLPKVERKPIAALNSRTVSTAAFGNPTHHELLAGHAGPRHGLKAWGDIGPTLAQRRSRGRRNQGRGEP